MRRRSGRAERLGGSARGGGRGFEGDFEDDLEARPDDDFDGELDELEEDDDLPDLWEPPEGEAGEPIEDTPPGTPAERAVANLGRLLLLGLLIALLAGAAGSELKSRPPVGDEATYVMQALSLAHDRDLAFADEDHRRYEALYGRPPDRLALASRDGGERIVYGVPFLWALWAAPFLAAAPQSGAAVANALLLAIAAWAAARALERRIGPAAWPWTAALVFASVAFAYVYLALPDLLLMAAAALGLALAYGRSEAPAAGTLSQIYGGGSDDAAGGGRGRFVLRWAIAGALLAIPAVQRPVYGVLLVAMLWVVPRRRRAAGIAALAAGAALAALAVAGGHWAAGGGWAPHAGRHSFTAESGYPGVDYPAEVWPGPAAAPAGVAAVAPGTARPPLSPRLWGWNAVYLAAGRDVGLIPYFLPGLLLLTLAAGRRGRWALAAGTALALAALLWLRPHNFFGGAEAIGNRFFLPLYPALWFLAARPGGRVLRRAAGALAAAALAAPFLLPLWREPAGHPVGEDGRYRYVSEVARRGLPFETTQPAIPAPRAAAGELVLTFLAGDAGPAGGDPRAPLRLRGRREVELMVASPRPLERLTLALGRRSPSRIEILSGGEAGEVLLRGDGGVSFTVELAPARATHPPASSAEPWSYYPLRFRLPEGPPFDLELGVEAGGVGGP